MIEIVLLVLGGTLGFAHAARNWLSFRMKQGYRCIPKVFIWRGMRNTVLSLSTLAVLVYLSRNAPATASDSVSPGAVLLGSLILLSMGAGIGNGLSNLFGGTLSFVTEGPYQPDEGSDRSTKSKPKTDNYGQIEK
jgi:hypothetical protein